MDNAKILVIGAGVNGSAVITKLVGAGLDAKVLARGKRYDEIKAEGIIIEDPFSHKRTITKVPVIDHLYPEDVYDFILERISKMINWAQTRNWERANGSQRGTMGSSQATFS